MVFVIVSNWIPAKTSRSLHSAFSRYTLHMFIAYFSFRQRRFVKVHILMLAYNILPQICVANPNKRNETKVILAKTHERLLPLLINLSAEKGKLGVVFLST